MYMFEMGGVRMCFSKMRLQYQLASIKLEERVGDSW